jgi:putative ABC transport system ATP-binding protein
LTENRPPAILEGRALRRTYHLGATRTAALRGVDLAVTRGELVVVQGRSGSGKTTLINLLGLLDPPDAGEVLLEGRAVHDLDEDARSALRLSRFGFVFQSYNLVPVLTAAENVELPLRLAQVPRGERRERAAALLAGVGLADKRDARPDLLSGGERQRVAIARALANAPSIVLADEPTASLDTATAAGILELFEGMVRERGLSLIVATHDPQVVARAGRVIRLADGQVAA